MSGTRWDRSAKIRTALAVTLGSGVLLAGAFRVEPAPSGAQSAPSGGTSASVRVTATISGVRLLVVDDLGRITEIWTNSRDQSAALRARRGDLSGPEIDVTSTLETQYRTLMHGIGQPTSLGRVYLAE